MRPIVCGHRSRIPGGLWTSKVGGDIKEGDPTLTQFVVEGRADIKELRGHMKLFFQGVTITQRPRILTENEKNKIRTQFRASNKVPEDLDELEDEERAAILEKEEAALQTLFKQEIDKQLSIPKLFVYLSKKKPKTRMTDIHKTGTRIFIPNCSDGVFGAGRSLGDFDLGLKDIVDVLGFLGLVIVKLPTDEPKTDDPVVYGYVNLLSVRSAKIRTKAALHFDVVSDMILKISTFLDPSKERKISDLMKPLSFYRSLTTKVWLSHQIEQDIEVDFKATVKFLQFCDIFLVETQAKRLFDAVDIRKSQKLGMLEFENILMANDVLGPAPSDILFMDIYDSFKAVPNEENKEFGKFDGMDYSAFCEAMNMLGLNSVRLEDLQKAFCHAGSVKVHEIEHTYINLLQFKRGWLQVANVEQEMKKRKMKYDSGALSENRNRERLIRSITEIEKAYLDSLVTVNEMIEKVKRERRTKKDDNRREFDAFKDKLQHDAEKFEALRGQEKRLQVKREQEEKSRKRLEEKVLRNKLLLRQAEATAARESEIQEAANKAEKLRQDEIRARGLDKLDLSVQRLREIPLSVYGDELAQRNLSYALLCDLSRNKLEELPRKNFLYWMTETRKLKLSDNHLYSIPDELEYMVSLEILELNTNRLTTLPPNMDRLTGLQRLDISNNQITFLPESLGMCWGLKYFCAHSNNLSLLPTSLASCFRLEYLDCSRNQLREIPEDIHNLIALYHLDVNSNRIGHLPDSIGSCEKLTYIDISTNLLAFLPATFSKLSNLEFCNLQNNDILITPGKLNNLLNLKSLSIRRNNIKELFSDVGEMKQLMYLDLSLNCLINIPPEIGLLSCVQELNLSYNKIETLVIELGKCLQLQKLELHNNSIQGELPESIGLLLSLRELNFSNNPITSIPRSILALKELRTIQADHCHLTSLPDTFTYLSGLELLDISNNKFSRFPIELHRMRQLQSLIISDNIIELLPRNINTVSFLSRLDLSKNQLRALPVEFVEVLESVPQVLLSQNPWNYFPVRWGKFWPEKQVRDGETGYNVAEAVAFLYGMKSFYDVAEAIWSEVGVFHYTNRLGLKDFIEEIRKRIPHSFEEGSQEYIEHIYFLARQSGVFPRFYVLKENEIEENQYRLAADDYRRTVTLEKIRNESHVLKKRFQLAYDSNVLQRAKTLTALTEEQRNRENIVDFVEKTAFHEALIDRQKIADKKLQKEQQKWATNYRKEANRLNGLLKK